MMWNRHAGKYLSAYLHNELSPSRMQEVRDHLEACAACRREFEEIRFGASLAQALPKAEAPTALWNDLERALDAQSNASLLRRVWWPQWPALRPAWWATAVGALAVVLAGVWLFKLAVLPHSPWEVVSLQGDATLGDRRAAQSARLPVGQWLVTGADARAVLRVGAIGEVEVEPESRLRVLRARSGEQRLALERGVIHATIWAPPGRFFVETPSAVAVDLGCAYTMEVDAEGSGVVAVSSGWVGFEWQGRESLVPAGAVCRTRRGVGPGTPFRLEASPALKQALWQLDFGNLDSERRGDSLATALSEAVAEDSFTLWHLLRRVDAGDRTAVFARLNQYVPVPSGVTLEGILQGDPSMLARWWDELGLGSTSWWRLWKQPSPRYLR